MRTVKAWIVDVYRTPWDWDDGDIAWTEIYEYEENARSAARLVERELSPLAHAEVYEDEVDIWDDDIFEKEDSDANELIPVARCVGSP